MKRILCLRLPNWPLQRLLAEQPALRGQPVVLHQRDARRGECIVACSPEALALGVQTGMPLGEATTLSQNLPPRIRDARVRTPRRQQLAPPLVAFPFAPDQDQAKLEDLAKCCDSFSPLVGWESTTNVRSPTRAISPWLDYLLLDVTGIGSLFGGELPLANQLAAVCRSQSYDPRIAIAETLGGAWALTAQAQPTKEKKDVTLIATGQIAAALNPLPVETLRVDTATVQLLLQLGVTCIEQLRQLPRGSLAARFGSLLLLRLDQALGEAGEVLIPFRPPPRFEAAWPLEHPTGHLEILAHVIQRLLERVVAALVQQNVGAVQLECGLECVSAASVNLKIGLFKPVATQKYLWDLLWISLERTQLPATVERVCVRAPLTAPLEQRQRTLFADSTNESEQALATLLDRLSLRLGPEAVVHPEIVADAVPERAFRYVPLTGKASIKTSPPSRKKRGASYLDEPTLCQRPLVLLRSPPRLPVVAIVPDGPPISFLYRNQQHQVARHWGPERIETGWWRGRTVRRDYYRVETTTGVWFWLFRALPNGQWHLHGLFE